MYQNFLLLAAILIGSGGIVVAENAKIEEPLAVVRTFYEGLDPDVQVHDLPEIFSDVSDLAPDIRSTNVAKYSGLNDLEVVWEFLRANRWAFLFEGINPKKTLDKARIAYLFFGFSSPEAFFDGSFGIEISLPLSKGAKEGIYKQVTLPMQKVKSTNGTEYKINIISIRINGALLDFSGEFDRTSDLWGLLGLNQDSPKGVQ